MSIDLRGFFLSALLVFGVLLPGMTGVAILAELATRWEVALPVGWPPASIFDWAAFFIAGYILGHLPHPLSHFLDFFYDHTYRAWWRRKGDPLLEAIRAIAGPDVGPMNSYFDWAKQQLKSKAQNDLERVETIEGISKGFRTLALIALGGSILAAATEEAPIAVICLVLLGLAFLVFCERRLAAANDAYSSVLRLEREAGRVQPGASVIGSLSQFSQPEPAQSVTPSNK